MRNILLITLCISTLMSCLLSCNNISTKSELNQADTITFNKVIAIDSIVENKSKTERYSIACNVEVDVPKEISIRKLFCTNILYINNDSLYSDNILISKYAKLKLDEIGIQNIDSIEADPDCDNDKCPNFLIDIKIFPKYNKNGIITFQRVERTIRDQQTAMISNSFFSFNVIKNEPIFFNNIFNEDDINIITLLLKEQLLRQLKVKEENVLYDMGYFNLDNLVANNNFEITSEGIAWTFQTYEIACFSIGETRIILPYSLISQYINDNSILSQFKTI